jgi:hypothetical protein
MRYIEDAKTAAASARIRAWLRARIRLYLSPIPGKPVRKMRKISDKSYVPKFLQPSKPRHLNRPKISPEEIVRREKAGESLESIAKSVGISLDRVPRLANRVRNRPMPACRHCQAPLKYRQCKYCVGCFQRRRMLQRRAVYNGPLGLQARAELKPFDKAEKGGMRRKKAA